MYGADESLRVTRSKDYVNARDHVHVLPPALQSNGCSSDPAGGRRPPILPVDGASARLAFSVDEKRMSSCG